MLGWAEGEKAMMLVWPIWIHWAGMLFLFFLLIFHLIY